MDTPFVSIARLPREDESSSVTLASNKHKSTKMLLLWPPVTALNTTGQKTGPWGAHYC